MTPTSFLTSAFTSDLLDVVAEGARVDSGTVTPPGPGSVVTRIVIVVVNVRAGTKTGSDESVA